MHHAIDAKDASNVISAARVLDQIVTKHKESQLNQVMHYEVGEMRLFGGGTTIH